MQARGNAGGGTRASGMRWRRTLPAAATARAALFPSSHLQLMCLPPRPHPTLLQG